jgi:hypothetical protein
MKVKISMFVIAIIISVTHILQAQNESDTIQNCKVLKENISLIYKGGCKDGLAHGNGIAVGIDKYDGKFKKGLPHGFGIYTKPTGEKFVGYFKEGNKHGKGKYSFLFNGRDSTINGFWKNDSLIKIIIPPYYKVDKNINVTRYSIQKMSNGDRVMFSFLQNGVQNTTITSFHLNSSKGTPITIGSKQGFENIEFPVTFRVTYITLNSLRTTTQRVEFEVTINQPGDWVVTLHN